MKTHISCEKEEKEFRDANEELTLMSERLLSAAHPVYDIDRNRAMPEIVVSKDFGDYYLVAKDNITKAKNRYDIALEALLDCRNKYYVGIVQYTSH